jgi:hypothetical protein
VKGPHRFLVVYYGRGGGRVSIRPLTRSDASHDKMVGSHLEEPMDDAKRAVLRDFRRIPGVGPSIAEDLWRLGMRSVEDLRGGDPEALYERLCEIQGVRIDRCMLYVLRCAVYYASEYPHDPEKLLWWNWKDPAPARPRRRDRLRSPGLPS